MKTIPNFEEKLALRARGKAPSPIRELLPYLGIPGMISLGGGYPNPETFVFSKVDFNLKEGPSFKLQDEALTMASQYGPSEGLKGFHEQLAEWHAAKNGWKPGREQMVVLNGCQEGLFIMAYLFCNEEDSILVSEPTYPGAISAFSSFCRRFVQVDLDMDGINTMQIEQTLSRMQSDGEKLPKFIYCIPNGHNPGGVSLSLERRKHLVRIASQFNILVTEDDPYELIRLEDTPPLPTLQSLDQAGLIVRLDSFSKIFIPGLRIGYATAHPEIIRQFVLFKQSSNLHTSSFNQMLLYRYLCEAGIETFMKHIRSNCNFYRNNRDHMVDAADGALKGLAAYNTPDSGMFIWFELHEGINTERMIRRHAQKHLVLVIPGAGFSTRGGLHHCLRATFGSVSPEKIESGIQRLAGMISEEME